MDLCVVGAGVTGLAAGMESGGPVFERADGAGGLCRSYRRGGVGGGDGFRFEVGGGHWLFGEDAGTAAMLDALTPMRAYERRAAVRLGDLVVPYPLQQHTDRLGPVVAARVAAERAACAPPGDARTLREWLECSFGATLCERFFFPFNDRYTAGLAAAVAPQDDYKSPTVSRPLPGYNARFRYPAGGLGRLVGAMASRADVRYGKDVVRIDTLRRTLHFRDGTMQRFGRLISTLPLHRAVELAGVRVASPPDPFTSVLVLNVAAERGPACPDVHWLYEARSESGFHRVGFYSNVDEDFLPAASRRTGRDVSLYLEWAYRGGDRPSPAGARRLAARALAELRRRGYVGRAHVVDPSWVEVAYTWSFPGSTWREEAIAALETEGVHQAGRYGRWRFQGIAESIREGVETARVLTVGREPQPEPECAG